MRKLIAVLLFLLPVLSSYGVTPKETEAALYNWGKCSNGVTEYERLAYKVYKTQTPEARCSLLCYYEDLVKNPTGARKLPPPGLCAEYGYLLLLSDTASLFAENATDAQKRALMGIDFRERGIEMFRMELEAYPESRSYVMPLLEKALEKE